MTTSVCAVVLHGRPGKFSAGFDLAVMIGGDIGAISALVADGGDLVRTLYGSSVPVVAACTGHALAAGALVLLGCDVRVGADVDGQGRSERGGDRDGAARVGVHDRRRAAEQAARPAGGRQRASHDAAGAVDVGFLDEVVPADDVLERGGRPSRPTFAAARPSAYARTVRRLRGDVLDPMAAQIAADPRWRAAVCPAV